MYKQAYLILAHKFDFTFQTLLQMLDREENDIFVHMDSKCYDFDEEQCQSLVKKSRLYFTERTNVTWGGYSQIRAEVYLLKMAINNGQYNYYHLLSGQDLPIKNGEYIKNFFIDNDGKEFVAFDNDSFEYSEQVRFYYPLQEIVGRNRRKVIGRISAGLTELQRKTHITRNNVICFQKGPNWFSITDEFARYIIQKEKWIQKVFRDTLCCDEVFLQTLVVNSEFRDRIYKGIDGSTANGTIMRYIDWERGSPYVFKIENLELLKDSKMIFARKFDAEVDPYIIQKIKELYS